MKNWGWKRLINVYPYPRAPLYWYDCVLCITGWLFCQVRGTDKSGQIFHLQSRHVLQVPIFCSLNAYEMSMFSSFKEVFSGFQSSCNCISRWFYWQKWYTWRISANPFDIQLFYFHQCIKEIWIVPRTTRNLHQFSEFFIVLYETYLFLTISVTLMKFCKPADVSSASNTITIELFIKLR